MAQPIRSFKDLVVWQKAIALAKVVYEVTRQFPPDERFGLTAQVRRAVVSVSSNIAEGHARSGNEFERFLSIARGSLAEVESQLLLAVELGFTTAPKIEPAESLMRELRLMLSALVKKLRDQRS